jgi:hypothetical protein
MYTSMRGLRKRFVVKQQQIVDEQNARGHGVVRRTPSDRALAGAAHSDRGMEALARAYTQPI